MHLILFDKNQIAHSKEMAKIIVRFHGAYNDIGYLHTDCMETCYRVSDQAGK